MTKSIDNLRESYELSSQQVVDAINPLDVAAIFEKENVSYVLIGGHMLSYYTGHARATVDVDFIIGGADFTRATKIIKNNYLQLKQNDRIYHVTYDTKKPNQSDAERIDLVKDGFPIFREVVEQFCTTLKTSKHTIKMPSIEAAIALKFSALISPNRSDENKSIDHADLLKLVRSTSSFEEKTLLSLGDLIYKGGGKELLSSVEDIQSGKIISL